MSERTQRHGPQTTTVTTLEVLCAEGPDTGSRIASKTDSLTIGTADGNDLILRDPTVSRFHVELRLEPAGIRVLDQGSTNGTWVGGVRIERGFVPPGTSLRLGKSAVTVSGGGEASLDVFDDERFGRLRGASLPMRRLMADMERASRSAVAVLLIGESGTGKEVVARTLHEESSRAAQPFVTVDCASLTPTLVASELFGHERGAFTGADRRHIGAFERASGGTIFLDELGELPPALQTSLLGVLERRKLRRLGGNEEVPVDVRVLSATHRDLRAEVNAGTFRLDLYYRLAVVTLRVPALREHIDDLPLLAEHFLREAGVEGPLEQWIGEPTLRALMAHRWPGNVRELRNVIEATLAMGQPPALSDPTASKPAPGVDHLLGLPYRDARSELLREFEQKYLAQLLARAKGNVSQAARDAKMDRTHLAELLRRHGLK